MKRDLFFRKSESRHSGTVRRLVAAAALNLVIPFGSWARANLVNSTVSEGGVVFERTFAVELSFDTRINQRRSKLTLENPAHHKIPVVIEDDPILRSKLLARISDLKPGSHKLHWEVLAVDGHTTRGVISFSVR
jgi:methionine-rich copper-binding protein CopC